MENKVKINESDFYNNDDNNYNSNNDNINNIVRDLILLNFEQIGDLIVKHPLVEMLLSEQFQGSMKNKMEV
jgi:hypothetical protein